MKTDFSTSKHFLTQLSKREKIFYDGEELKISKTFKKELELHFNFKKNKRHIPFKLILREVELIGEEQVSIFFSIRSMILDVYNFLTLLILIIIFVIYLFGFFKYLFIFPFIACIIGNVICRLRIYEQVGEVDLLRLSGH